MIDLRSKILYWLNLLEKEHDYRPQVCADIQDTVVVLEHEEEEKQPVTKDNCSCRFWSDRMRSAEECQIAFTCPAHGEVTFDSRPLPRPLPRLTNSTNCYSPHVIYPKRESER